MIERLADIPAAFWTVLSEMAPFLLFGFLIAGVLSVLIRPETIERHLGGRGLWQVLKAAAIGVPLPLCSCGVIPVAASLRRHGASRGATTAFLISTPQDGVDSIMVSFSLLGAPFAIFRPIVALISGLVGGAIVTLFHDKPQAETEAAPGNAGNCTDDCCNPERGGRVMRILRHGFVTLPADIGRSLLIGLLVAALLTAIIPKGYFATHLGRGLVPILVMMALGVPVYVCATASIPIAAALVIEGGISPGAALAFLMTGPATNAATIATIWRTMGHKTAVAYLLTVAISALAAGLTMDYVFHVQGIRAAPGLHMMEGGWFIAFRWVCAVVLLAVLCWPMVFPLLRRRVGHVPAGEKAAHLRLAVEGMTCHHCVGSVRQALQACAGVTEVHVDLDAGSAQVAGEGLDPDALCAAVHALGYSARAAGPGAD
ncbi:MAG TPA: SO_0444 family Cu/Zn efflux transporter [Phycisphaerae bacterium]|nr:SO_0444 family Cu/Zn efflux transporter [Phycisphaerae bacterium]